jgi:hypothetical protein
MYIYISINMYLTCDVGHVHGTGVVLDGLETRGAFPGLKLIRPNIQPVVKYRIPVCTRMMNRNIKLGSSELQTNKSKIVTTIMYLSDM